MIVNVIGAGLAGSEAAFHLAEKGIKVRLYEMKPSQRSEVHKLDGFAELVCSNSFGADSLTNASGLLKEEARILGSMLVNAAYESRVPAGQALAVDRDIFSEIVTSKIKQHPNIEIVNEEAITINTDEFTIIATGPLTSEKMSAEIMKLVGSDYLYFYDAVAPILTLESIDKDKVYFASRYDKGEGEYINCPMTKDEYQVFYNALISAERIPLKKFEEVKVFEACMPVEKMAERGEKTLLFGPMKPKGLVNPKTGREDYAVVQLRQDDKSGRIYNIVGFQTNLKWGEQKRVFSMIPGLENAEFIRFGVMHRNNFINSTKLLNKDLSLKSNGKIYFAGQITGSEGYVAAIATGLIAAENVYRKISGKESLILEDVTMAGALINYITEEKKVFQPMGPNFGIIRENPERIRDKKKKYEEYAKRSLDYLGVVKGGEI